MANNPEQRPTQPVKPEELNLSPLEGSTPPINPLQLNVVSFDDLRDREISLIQGNRGRILDPMDTETGRNEQADTRANARLANEIDREIQRSTGLSRKQTDDLADEWLKEHGAGDLVDPNLK